MPVLVSGTYFARESLDLHSITLIIPNLRWIDSLEVPHRFDKQSFARIEYFILI